MDVYCRALLARNASGVARKSFPVLAIPPGSTAAGILSVLPLNALHIEDLTHPAGFKFLLINCDGANTNRKAVRMLMSELQNRRDLLVVVNFCSAHGINRAVKWGLGVFFYGDFLRCCHVLQAVKQRNFDAHVCKMLRQPPLNDSALMGERLRRIIYTPSNWGAKSKVKKLIVIYRMPNQMKLRRDQKHLCCPMKMFCGVG